MGTLNDNVNEWIKLNKSGNFQAAKDFYFNTLFSDVLSSFEQRFSRTLEKVDVLFSILGFTPEPILLTQRALKPQTHIIFYTNKGKENEETINSYLEKFSSQKYNLVELSTEKFDDIYETLKEQMLLYPANSYAIDITGGKKSMVASASIFGRDYNFNVLYVDFDRYDSELRRPEPGSERLNLVYSPKENLPEIYHSDVRTNFVREVDDDFDINRYINKKKYAIIKDINYWGYYGFDTAKEVIKQGDTYIAIW
jgi:hypothetical protein